MASPFPAVLPGTNEIHSGVPASPVAWSSISALIKDRKTEGCRSQLRRMESTSPHTRDSHQFGECSRARGDAKASFDFTEAGT